MFPEWHHEWACLDFHSDESNLDIPLDSEEEYKPQPMDTNDSEI